MSMLSAQCDELRQTAESVGLAMPQAATLMMEAADTILSLRDRAQDLQAENAKLRDGANAMRQLYEDELKHALDENAKLRELAARAYKTARMMCEAWDGPCQSNSDVPSWRVPCPTDERDEQCVFGQIERDMRELGAEVTA